MRFGYIRSSLNHFEGFLGSATGFDWQIADTGDPAGIGGGGLRSKNLDDNCQTARAAG